MSEAKAIQQRWRQMAAAARLYLTYGADVVSRMNSLLQTVGWAEPNTCWAGPSLRASRMNSLLQRVGWALPNDGAFLHKHCVWLLPGRPTDE